MSPHDESGSESDTVRRLRYELKQANRQCGRQGETIHQLRGHIALLRAQAKIALVCAEVEADRVAELRRQVEELTGINRAVYPPGALVTRPTIVEPSSIEGLA